MMRSWLVFVLAWVGLGCRHDATEAAATARPPQPALTDSIAPPSEAQPTRASGAPRSARADNSAPACPSPLGESSISFVDVSDSKAQKEYSDAYNYMIGVIEGPRPPTHVDITVSGHGILGGVRARIARRPNGDLELLADPAPPDPESAAWQPKVKAGEHLATITLTQGVATGLVLPKPAAPDRGLPVHHPGTPLVVEP